MDSIKCGPTEERHYQNSKSETAERADKIHLNQNIPFEFQNPNRAVVTILSKQEHDQFY